MRRLLVVVLVACGGHVMAGPEPDAAGDAPIDAIDAMSDLCDGGSCSATFVMVLPLVGEWDGAQDFDVNAWTYYGEDIDGKTTDSSSTDVCALPVGVPSSAQTDGQQGRDNSFGENVLPILRSAGDLPDPSRRWMNAIADGVAHSLLFTITIHGSSITARMRVAAPLKMPASTALDSSDTWPVSGLATEGAVADLEFPSATFVDHTLVSGRAKQRGLIVWDTNGAGLPIPIDDLQFRLLLFYGLSDIHGEGEISGVLAPEAFIHSLEQSAGNLSTKLCGSALDGVAQQIRQTVDILQDGTNRSGVPCTSISFGFGFQVKRATIGPTVSESIVNGCP